MGCAVSMRQLRKTDAYAEPVQEQVNGVEKRPAKRPPYRALLRMGSSPNYLDYQPRLSPINSFYTAAAKLVSNQDGVLQCGFSPLEAVDIFN